MPLLRVPAGRSPDAVVVEVVVRVTPVVVGVARVAVGCVTRERPAVARVLVLPKVLLCAGVRCACEVRVPADARVPTGVTAAVEVGVAATVAVGAGAVRVARRSVCIWRALVA